MDRHVNVIDMFLSRLERRSQNRGRALSSLCSFQIHTTTLAHSSLDEFLIYLESRGHTTQDLIMLAHQIAALFWLLGSLASVQASPTPHTSAAHSLVGYAPHLSSAPTPSIEGPPGGPAQGPGLSQCNAQCTFAAAEKVDCGASFPLEQGPCRRQERL